ncbi:hypothetical protein CSC12_6309 (plasmid) [Klebsiella michiganensis]|nr:hypothetical protein CSC12_6309 [Klebsiella michiganensis]
MYVEGCLLYIKDDHIWNSGGVCFGYILMSSWVEDNYGFRLAQHHQSFFMYLHHRECKL